jgi:hypothetical protein
MLKEGERQDQIHTANRGILPAFCRRERGRVSNLLVHEYVKTFPHDFPEGEQGTVMLYPA